MFTAKEKKYFAGLLTILVFGMLVGLYFNIKEINRKAVAEDLKFDEQEATIRAIKKVLPSVVSIDVYGQKEQLSINLGTLEQKTTKSREKLGAGTGFLISPDGLIITNKHVIGNSQEMSGEYKITLNSGREYYGQFIGNDPINDLAILKIFDKDLPYVELGDSDRLEVGSAVIAIGNSLGKYMNSVTKGIVSGLERNLVASDNSGNTQNLSNVIQTDAEINLGNSGGPLVNLEGKVVGVNVAIDQAGSSIGFAIPINDARPVIKSIKEVGMIVRPKLGVRYQMLTPVLAEKNKLSRSAGAWLIKGENGDPAVLPNSPAEKAGLMEGDIIFEVNAIKVEGKNNLLAITQRYKPKNKIGLKIQRGEKVLIMVVELGEFK